MVESIHINYNNILGNAGDGVNAGFAEAELTYTGPYVDAILNFWDGACGPSHPSNKRAGLCAAPGESVGDYVDYKPWLASPVRMFGGSGGHSFD